MTHNPRVRPNLAAWALNSTLMPAEIYAVDAAFAAALNGDAGGNWSPSSKIVIAGANGLDVNVPFRVLGSSGYNASMQAQCWLEHSTVPTSGSALNSDVPIAFDPSAGVASGPIYCALGSDQFPYTSEDGNLWTRRATIGGPFALNAPANDIAAGAVAGVRTFAATSSANGNLISSTDGGITWAQPGGVSGLVGTASVIAYSSSLGIWVAAGAAGVVYTSTDLATWTARTTPAGWVAGSGGAKRIVWNGSLFVVLPRGVYGKFLTSSDGITWTERTVTTVPWRGLAYGPYDGIWMACSFGGAVATSQDGINWVTSFSPTFPGCNDLAVNNSLWVAASIAGAKGGVLWSVDKGATWLSTAVGNHRVATDGFQRVICADNRFVVAQSTSAAIEIALSMRSS